MLVYTSIILAQVSVNIPIHGMLGWYFWHRWDEFLGFFNKIGYDSVSYISSNKG